MITRIPGWTFRYADDHITLAPRDQPGRAWIRYVERMQPVASVDALVRRHCAASLLRVRTVHPLESALTQEGEQALVLTLDCEEDDAVVQRTLGFVLLDDFYSETVGIARTPELRGRVRDAVKRLVGGDVHMLAGRRRPFPYEGPSGWTRRLRGTALEHLWLPPDHPADATRITVAAAWPTAGSSPRDVARLLLARSAPGFTVLAHEGPELIVNPSGLTGKLWRRSGRRRGVAWTQLIAILSRDSHSYLLSLDSALETEAANERLFRAVLASVRPLPLAPQALVQRASALRHWAD